jgi:hypothetical protein
VRFGANMRNCVINEPAALQQQTAVASCHRSALGVIPINLFPVVETVLDGIFVVDIHQFHPWFRDVKLLFCAFV